MAPILLQLGPVTLYSYGVMMAVAFGASTWAAVSSARRLPAGVRVLTPDMVVDGACAALFGGILGGRLFYVFLHLEEFRAEPLEAVAIWHGGLVWYGGFLGGLAGGWFYARGKRLPFLRVLDQMCPSIALGHAFGRLGCFLNGCCYGAPSDAWCAVRFPALPEPVLPTQLFEAFGLVILFGVLRWGLSRGWLTKPGLAFGIYCVAYAALRFGLEFLRGDQTRFWIGLTLQQLISFGVLAVGLLLTARSRR